MKWLAFLLAVLFAVPVAADEAEWRFIQAQFSNSGPFPIRWEPATKEGGERELLGQAQGAALWVKLRGPDSGPTGVKVMVDLQDRYRDASLALATFALKVALPDDQWEAAQRWLGGALSRMKGGQIVRNRFGGRQVEVAPTNEHFAIVSFQIR